MIMDLLRIVLNLCLVLFVFLFLFNVFFIIIQNSRVKEVEERRRKTRELVEQGMRFAESMRIPTEGK